MKARIYKQDGFWRLESDRHNSYSCGPCGWYTLARAWAVAEAELKYPHVSVGMHHEFALTK